MQTPLRPARWQTARRIVPVLADCGRRGFVALVAALALAVVAAPSASAHDSLLSSSPSDGQSVATVPDHIVLTMNEAPVPVGTRVIVQGPDGEVQQGKPQLVKNIVRQAVAPGSPAGRYTVVWRVTSVDGHPVSGTFTFTADGAGTVASGPATSTPDAQGSTTTTPAGDAPSTTTAGQTEAPVAGPTSSTSTGHSGQSGTFWALWLVVAILVMAGVGAALVRRRRRYGERGDG